MKDMQQITYPSTCSIFGAAEWVKFGHRIAKVKLPGNPEPVTIPRSELLPVKHWNAFYLADRANETLSLA